jgi:hypothetical protein
VKYYLGDTLFRNPASLINVSNKFVNSTAHSLITTGAQSSESFSIPNPDYQGKDGEPSKLSGRSSLPKNSF